MGDRRQQQQPSRALEPVRTRTVVKKTLATATAASPSRSRTPTRGNHAIADEREVRERRLAQQDAAIALAQRATSILNAQRDPETLDLRPFAAELNDVLMDELARQLDAILKRVARGRQLSPLKRRNNSAEQQSYQQPCYSTLVLSGCDKFTPVGIRSFIHAVGASIRYLDISKTTLSLESLTVLATGIALLEALDCSWCLELTSERVRAFLPCCNSELTKLNLSNCPALNDDALGWISGTLGAQGSRTQCKRLLSLDVSYTRGISDRGLAAVGRGCCLLQFVNLEGLERISSTGILALVAGCTRLRVVSLRKCLQLTDSALVAIGQHCRQLQSLNVCGCIHLSSVGLLAMVRGTPALQALNLEGCPRMQEDVLAAVATQCLSLHVLNVNGCQEITDNGLATLCEHLPFVQRASSYRGLEPKRDGLALKFSVQQRTIYNSAALRIQAVYRGHVARRVAATWRTQMIEAPATRTIRKCYVRWRLCNAIDQRVARTLLVTTSNVKIQALVRGVLCRTALAQTLDDMQRLRQWSLRAVKIQAVYRSHFTRRRYHVVYRTIERYRRDKALVARHRAATLLQRAYRKRFHRSQLDDVMRINQQRRRERTHAAITLQRLFRTRAARKTYRHLQAALAQQLRNMRALEQFAVTIQRRWRGHCARQQRAFYQQQLQAREQRRNAAASRINAGVRGYYGRRIAQQQLIVRQTRLSAARRIQRAYRRYKAPSADRLQFDAMLARLQVQLLDESAAAASKQYALLRAARDEINRDSASDSDDDDDWRDFVDPDSNEQFWFSPSRQQRVFVRPHGECARERAMLGLSCRVYWPLEQQWFSGVVTRFHRSKHKHCVVYDDGDHEWLDVRRERDRVQLDTRVCWCMAAMFAPALRTLRAAVFVTLCVQCYDASVRCWRTGVLKAYNEETDCFLLSYDDDNGTDTISRSTRNAGAKAAVGDAWVDVFCHENYYQVQDATTSEWYSLSGYVFGRARGRPLNFLTMANGRPGAAEWFYSVNDYLTYVDEPAVVAVEEEWVEGGYEAEVSMEHSVMDEGDGGDHVTGASETERGGIDDNADGDADDEDEEESGDDSDEEEDRDEDEDSDEESEDDNDA